MQGPNSSWSASAVESGNDLVPLGAETNELAGPRIFDQVDEQMRQNILRHHGGG